MVSPDLKYESDNTTNGSSIMQSHNCEFTNNGDYSDTAEDATTETVSKGKLKHEVQMLHTRLIENSTNLEVNRTSSIAREEELMEQIKALTLKLNLINSRYNALVESHSQTNDLKNEFAETIAFKRRLINENDLLKHDLNEIRQLILNFPKTIHSFINNNNKIDLKMFSKLDNEEFETLSSKPESEQTTVELIQIWIHQILSTISQNQISVPSDNLIKSKKSNPDIIQKRVQFVDASTNVKYSPTDDLKVNQLRTEYSTIDTDENELSITKKKLQLLKLDKEYLLKQLSSLRIQLKDAEEKLEKQIKRTIQLELERNESQELLKHQKFPQKHQEQTLTNDSLESGVQNQTLKLTNLMQTQFEQLKFFTENLNQKEMNLLKMERDQLMIECEKLKNKLSQNTIELEQIKQNTYSKFNNLNDENINSLNMKYEMLEKKFNQTMIELDLEKSARKSDQIQLEKLAALLDASKRSYYELKTKYDCEQTVWLNKCQNYEQQIKNCNLIEKQFDQLIKIINNTTNKNNTNVIETIQDNRNIMENNLGFNYAKLNMDDNYSYNIVNLLNSKQVDALKNEIQNLNKQLTDKTHELEEARHETGKYRDLIALNNQPVSSLAYMLSERDNQLQNLQNQLENAEQKILSLENERCRLSGDKNALSQDLERVLTRRQSLDHLRQFLVDLLVKTENHSYIEPLKRKIY